MEERSNISVVEALFVLLICVGLDLMELTLSFTGISILLSVLDFFVWMLFTILFAFKGGGYGSRMKKRLAVWTSGNILELVPILEMLPIRTAAMLWLIWDWNKETDVGLVERVNKISHYSGLAEKFVDKKLQQEEN